MTREETKKAIEVMQHFENGGEVTLTWFDGLEEARAFCRAFEDSRILGTLEDLID